MTGTHTHDRQFSRFTLAVLEDTGWYHVNYDLADQLVWGRDLGCDFVKKSCKSWMDIRKSRSGNGIISNIIMIIFKIISALSNNVHYMVESLSFLVISL